MGDDVGQAEREGQGHHERLAAREGRRIAALARPVVAHDEAQAAPRLAGAAATDVLEGVALVAHAGEPGVGGGDDLGEPVGQDVRRQPHLQAVVGCLALGEGGHRGRQVELLAHRRPRRQRGVQLVGQAGARARGPVGDLPGGAARSRARRPRVRAASSGGAGRARASRSSPRVGLGQHRLGGRQSDRCGARPRALEPVSSSVASSAARAGGAVVEAGLQERPGEGRLGLVDGDSRRGLERGGVAGRLGASARGGRPAARPPGQRRDARPGPTATCSSSSASRARRCSRAGRQLGDPDPSDVAPRRPEPRRGARPRRAARRAVVASRGGCGLGPGSARRPADHVVDVVGGHVLGDLQGGRRARWRLPHPQVAGVLDRLGVVDRPLGLALGRRVGMGSHRAGRMRMVGRTADRAVVADGQRAGELGGHPGDPAFADVEQPLAQVEQRATAAVWSAVASLALDAAAGAASLWAGPRRAEARAPPRAPGSAAAASAAPRTRRPARVQRAPASRASALASSSPAQRARSACDRGLLLPTQLGQAAARRGAGWSCGELVGEPGELGRELVDVDPAAAAARRRHQHRALSSAARLRRARRPAAPAGARPRPAGPRRAARPHGVCVLVAAVEPLDGLGGRVNPRARRVQLPGGCRDLCGPRPRSERPPRRPPPPPRRDAGGGFVARYVDRPRRGHARRRPRGAGRRVRRHGTLRGLGQRG